MPYSIKEKNVIDNYKEQYNSILKNIKIANNRLESILGDIRSSEVTLRELDSEIASKQRLVELNVEKNAIIKEGLGELLKKKDKVRFSQEEMEEGFAQDIIAIIERNKALGRILATKRKNLEESQWELEQRKKVITKNDNKIDIQEKVLSDLKESNSKLEDKYLTLNDSYNTKEGVLQQRSIEQDKELKRINDLVNKEKNKAIFISKNIAEREDVLIQKERDIQILINRLRQVFRERFPGVSFSL